MCLHNRTKAAETMIKLATGIIQYQPWLVATQLTLDQEVTGSQRAKHVSVEDD